MVRLSDFFLSKWWPYLEGHWSQQPKTALYKKNETSGEVSLSWFVVLVGSLKRRLNDSTRKITRPKPILLMASAML